MGRTSFLVAIAIAAMLLELFPSQGGLIKWVIILLAALYLVVRLARTLPRQYREKRRRAMQLAVDAQEYRLYEAELEAIRNKYDPNRLGVEGALPAAYQDELTALSEKHRAMLTRKFGAY